MAAWKGSSVLITGGNRGLGLEMVRQFLESPNPPDQVFAGCRDPEGPRAKCLKDLSKKHSERLFIVQLDITDPVSIKEAAKQVESKLNNRGLNLLINNAAINLHRTLDETDSDDMMRCYKTNVVGPMLMAKEFLPCLKMAAQSSDLQGMCCRKAAVINLSTLVASIEKCPETFGVAPMYPYRTSKAALNMLTQCLSEDFRKEEILCNAIHPGWVKTDMGGKEAPLDVVDSVGGVFQVLSALTEKNAGQCLDWEGKIIPW
ncbi:C-signal-like [Acipenser ruthenus]|uniref:C-signal-like n=1 Tax=Acipenser ruthenus TaxID=7906 RepID=UPI00145B7475|nr:C-signal-like [Acipenser ruthenus]